MAAGDGRGGTAAQAASGAAVAGVLALVVRRRDARRLALVLARRQDAGQGAEQDAEEA